MTRTIGPAGRAAIAAVLAASIAGAGAPAVAQVTPQPSSPVQLNRCDYVTYGTLYNTPIHYDLYASFVDRGAQAVSMVGITVEFFDEQGNVVRKLDAAYSGRFARGQPVEHLRFGLGDAPNPTATRRCFVARVEFADGSVWSVADHYAEVERPPTKCRVEAKDGTSFDAAWGGALCSSARETWAAAHRSPTAQQPPNR
jgi:hypothetical protein